MAFEKTQFNDEPYELPAVAVDIVAFVVRKDELRTLLIKRGEEPFAGMWAFPGGFVEIDEDLDAAARRELAEETGITDVYIEQLHAFGAPDRDPRMRVISITYLTIVAPNDLEPQAADDAADAGWFPVNDLPPLAFDHEHILATARDHLQAKVQISDIAFHLLPASFTLSQLQTAYELTLGEMLDKRNFRRKMLQAGILEDTGHTNKNGEGRPARLYTYTGPPENKSNYRRLYP